MCVCMCAIYVSVVCIYLSVCVIYKCVIYLGVLSICTCSVST